MEERDVTQILSAATDSVDLINGVNDGSWNVEGMEQSDINDMVQRNVCLLYTSPSPRD